MISLNSFWWLSFYLLIERNGKSPKWKRDIEKREGAISTGRKNEGKLFVSFKFILKFKMNLIATDLIKVFEQYLDMDLNRQLWIFAHTMYCKNKGFKPRFSTPI